MAYTWPRVQRLRKIDEDGAVIARVLEWRRAKKNFIDVQRVGEIDLDAVAIDQHAEADGVFPADELLFRVDANVEMVIEEVVVGAKRAVGAAQHIVARRDGRGYVFRRGRPLGRRRLGNRFTGGLLRASESRPRESRAKNKKNG